jgi:F0F1-type ATP synthase assembly protein I
VFNLVMVPVRALAGGILFTAGIGFDVDTGSVPWLVVGALIAGVVAVLKVVLRPPAGVASPAYRRHSLAL